MFIAKGITGLRSIDCYYVTAAEVTTGLRARVGIRSSVLREDRATEAKTTSCAWQRLLFFYTHGRGIRPLP